ncbi:hypothetical protein T4E_1972 [Trichinella pseudospiralis]|uniref:Uncharacterized protein n=1 Tax=Trichinella pseudospiralis TaxID=6337 RepID=A0A0V0YCF6_TRIPS|nr:hypothetical protein T4E_1972 [Trichinella pseudospiralis]
MEWNFSSQTKLISSLLDSVNRTLTLKILPRETFTFELRQSSHQFHVLLGGPYWGSDPFVSQLSVRHELFFLTSNSVVYAPAEHVQRKQYTFVKKGK